MLRSTSDAFLIRTTPTDPSATVVDNGTQNNDKRSTVQVNVRTSSIRPVTRQGSSSGASAVALGESGE